MKPTLAHKLTHGEKEVITHRRFGPVKMPHDKAKQALFDIKQVFDKHEITFFLIFGTLLMAYRDGKFMPWEKDIDLGCYASDEEKLYDAIVELQGKGFEVTRTSADDSSFQLKRGAVFVDFGVMSRHRESMWRYGRFYETWDCFSELKPFSFLGMTFMIPKETERYLAQHYHGDDWKTPNPKVKHARLFRVRKRYL